jgi:hypothetical protein
MCRLLVLRCLVTGAVVVLPAVIAGVLRATGIVTHPALCILLSAVLAVAFTFLGAAIWERKRRPSDALFSDLLAWGWLQGKYTERQVDRSLRRLDGGSTQNPEERAAVLERLAVALDARDPFLHGHSRRVAHHSTEIARRMLPPRPEVGDVRRAAILHDVGKLNTPPEILNKPGALTDAEYEVVKRHVHDGAGMVDALGDRELTAAVLYHHERLDGSGYLAGLEGTRIPLAARIIAVADTFDAITSERPYRHAAPQEKALEILSHEAGHKLDPRAVRAFLAYYKGRGSSAFWSGVLAAPWASLVHSLFTAPVAAVVAGALAVPPVTAAGHRTAPASRQVHRHAQPASAGRAGADPLATAATRALIIVAAHAGQSAAHITVLAPVPSAPAARSPASTPSIPSPPPAASASPLTSPLTTPPSSPLTSPLAPPPTPGTSTTLPATTTTTASQTTTSESSSSTTTTWTTTEPSQPPPNTTTSTTESTTTTTTESTTTSTTESTTTTTTEAQPTTTETTTTTQTTPATETTTTTGEKPGS